MAPTPMVPTAWGDLIDKITILEIKNLKIETPTARANLQKELVLLIQIAKNQLEMKEVVDVKGKLYSVNLALWEVEDSLREKEREKAFDEEFISLARSVYRLNDERAVLKRSLNDIFGSEIVEEKSYKAY